MGKLVLELMFWTGVAVWGVGAWCVLSRVCFWMLERTAKHMGYSEQIMQWYVEKKVKEKRDREAAAGRKREAEWLEGEDLRHMDISDVEPSEPE